MTTGTDRRWWLAYDNGEVWPCEVIGPSLVGHWHVRPLAPAPDAGTDRIEPTRRVYDNRLQAPKLTDFTKD
jgi:hypothetical protein